MPRAATWTGSGANWPRSAARSAEHWAWSRPNWKLHETIDGIRYLSTGRPHFFAGRDRLAEAARPPRPALAEHARRLPHLAVRNHAAADPGHRGAGLLRAF